MRSFIGLTVLSAADVLQQAAALAIGGQRSAPLSDSLSESRTQELVDLDVGFETEGSRIELQSNRNKKLKYSVNITCDGEKRMIPSGAVLLEHNGKKALWCPTAKVGSSAFVQVIEDVLDGRSSSGRNNDKEDKVAKEDKARHRAFTNVAQNLVDAGREHELCGVDFSFLFIRNPWDRFYSGYAEKVVEKNLVVGTTSKTTVAQFANMVENVDPLLVNTHWQPISQRCLTRGGSVFHYDKVYKLEDGFEEAMADALVHLGVSHEAALAGIGEVGDSNRNKANSHTLASRIQVIDKVSEESIGRYYADDVSFGNYRFDSYN